MPIILYNYALSSLATLELMLAIEDAVGIEIPKLLVDRSTFESIDSTVAAVDSSR